MAVFQDSQQFYATVGELLRQAACDPGIGASVARAEIIVQFCYVDPPAQITLKAKDRPTQPDAYFDVIFGPSDLKPDVVMTMSADLAHEFWQGRLNLFSALARGQVQATGSVDKVLRLVPAAEPLYQRYLTLLRDRGLEHLILK
jgi:hypothetical protein